MILDPKSHNILKDFSEGTADFVLIAATTCSPAQISPAIRSRCAEVFLNLFHLGKLKIR